MLLLIMCRCSAQHLAEVCVQCMTGNVQASDEVNNNNNINSIGNSTATSAASTVAKKGNGNTPVVVRAFYDDMVVLSKDERLRRMERQGYLFDVLTFLLTTPTL